MLFILLFFLAFLNSSKSNFIYKNTKPHINHRFKPAKHKSPLPIGADDEELNSHKIVLTGFTNPDHTMNPYFLPMYSIANRTCISWATATTAAMSMSLSIHSKRQINLSLQYILDCDYFGEPCSYRPSLNAYEQFYRRFIPQYDRWDDAPNPLRTPTEKLTKEICDDNNGCFPGWSSCPRNRVLTGRCDGYTNERCPVHYLGNWKKMKSFLWEVGPITSTIHANREFIAHSKGVYYDVKYPGQDDALNEPLLDVTIIGWGEEQVLNGSVTNKWWYVVPHLGSGYGELSDTLFPDENMRKKILGYSDENIRTGIYRVVRRYDVLNIESNSFGAVPFNFRPKPLRTPKPTI